jgi:RNA polymerase sigma factor (TIGR02999 family)
MKIPDKKSPSTQDQPITELLQEFASGDKGALDRLLPLIYPELRRLARSYMRNENPGHTLQATALVHEAYARLVKQDQPDYSNRAHFMGVAAQVMRQILIDHARSRDAGKRGGGLAKVSLELAAGVPDADPSMIIAVDAALQALARNDSLKARLVEMRFFGGMTAEESAEVLKLPVAEVRRHLRVGQAWLQRELDQSSLPDKKD